LIETTKPLFILVAEDDTQTQLSLDVTLRRAGHQTLLAVSADALLNMIDRMPIAQRKRIDLLVTDINMPGTKGGQLIRALDTRGLFLPVVVITAYGTTALEGEFAARGAVSLLSKPFRPEALVGMVEKTYTEFKTACIDGEAVKTAKGGVCP